MLILSNLSPPTKWVAGCFFNVLKSTGYITMEWHCLQQYLISHLQCHQQGWINFKEFVGEFAATVGHRVDLDSSLSAALWTVFLLVVVFFFLMESFGLEGTTDLLVYSCFSRITWNRQTRTVAIWVFSIITAGDDSASLRNLFWIWQHSQ